MSEFIKLTDDSILVYVAESVDEAEALLSDANCIFPEVIYVDLNMPILNGFDFIELFERNFVAEHPETRLFMLSSSLRNEDRHRALMFRSVHDFVSKNDIDSFLQGTLTKAVA